MKLWTRRLLKITIISLCLYAYLTLGAIVFILLEAEHRSELVRKSRQELELALPHFIVNHGTQCGATADEVAGLLDHVQTAWEQGVFSFNANHTTGMEPVWNIADSFVFAVSVVTTIGYGNIVPRTTAGRVFCIVYASVGIPLCCSMLLVVGKTFQAAWTILFRSLADLKWRAARQTMYLVMPATSLWIFVAVIPTLTLMLTENWTYMTAQFFSFTSLSTIGFGDEHPVRTKPYTWYAYAIKIILGVYVLFSLSIVSITFTGVCVAFKKSQMKKRQKRRKKKWENHLALGDVTGITHLSYTKTSSETPL